MLKYIGKLTNEELAKVQRIFYSLLSWSCLTGVSPACMIQTFAEWNHGELNSFLIEITSIIFTKKSEDGKEFVVDQVSGHI